MKKLIIHFEKNIGIFDFDFYIDNLVSLFPKNKNIKIILYNSADKIIVELKECLDSLERKSWDFSKYNI